MSYFWGRLHYDRLKSAFPNKHLQLVAERINKFLENFKDFEFDEQDFINLIKIDKVEIDDMANIVPLIGESVIIGNKELSALLCDLLAKSKPIVMCFALMNSLFINGKSASAKVKLLNMNFSKLLKNEVETLVGLLPYPYKKKVVTRKRPRISLSKDNITLVENLKSINLITSFEVGKSSIKVVAKY